jgi:type I restriction enzyme S subunit
MSELPKGWAPCTLEECCAIISGQSPPGETYNEEGIGLPFYQGKAEFNDLFPTPRKWCTEPTKTAVAGDVLISVRAPVGPTNLASEPCCIGRGLAALRPLHGVETRFVLYQMRATEQQLASVATGSTFSAVSSQQLKEHLFVLAPSNEQSRIVAEIEKQFTRLDAATAALKRVQANLKRYRASVLKAACQRILRERRVRWEADTLAKMQASGKPPKDDYWKQKYKEPSAPDAANLPELPEGWCWTSLGQVFGVYVGATPSRGIPDYWNGPIPWVSSGEVAFCRITSTREAITKRGLRETSTDVHPPGTVLIGMIGEGKTRGQVAILDIAACNNQNSAAIRVSEAGLPPEFVYRYLEGIYEQTRNLSSGNNQPALNKARVQEIIFPLPPLEEQKRISMETERILSVADATEYACKAQMGKAQAMRTSILQKAFTGQLVPQDPTDEHASALLERIRAERRLQNSQQRSGRARRAAAWKGEL